MNEIQSLEGQLKVNYQRQTGQTFTQALEAVAKYVPYLTLHRNVMAEFTNSIGKTGEYSWPITIFGNFGPHALPGLCSYRGTLLEVRMSWILGITFKFPLVRYIKLNSNLQTKLWPYAEDLDAFNRLINPLDCHLLQRAPESITTDVVASYFGFKGGFEIRQQTDVTINFNCVTDVNTVAVKFHEAYDRYCAKVKAKDRQEDTPYNRQAILDKYIKNWYIPMRQAYMKLK